MTKEKKINIHDNEILLSKLDKTFFPASGITKRDIIDYYRKIWGEVEPHTGNRPMVLQRFPDGIEGEGFYQKKVPVYFPDWINTISVDVKKGNTKEEYVNCDSEETITYLADQGVLTMHLWLSKKNNLNKPDRLAFDFDPSDDDFEKVRNAALTLGKVLDSAGIVSYPMTTGSRGLHVIIPIKPEEEFDKVREVAKKIAVKIVERDEQNFTTETSKSKRKDKVFIDYLRNAYGQTMVMPYSIRPLEEAPVAVPIEWDEIKDKDLHPRKYTIKNIFRRVSRKEDPWKGIDKNQFRLKDIEEKMLKTT
jgi:bifunctional non-homologous end joining protein LigD